MNEDEYHGTNREEDRDGASMGKKDGKEKRDLEFGREGGIQNLYHLHIMRQSEK